MAEARHSFALGKDCSLLIDGFAIQSAQDVFVRQAVSSINATPRNSHVAVSIPIQWTAEIDFSVVDKKDMALLLDKRVKNIDGVLYPNAVFVSVAGGVFADTILMTVHDISGDEPLNGPVVGRFSLKQWVGTNSGPVGTASNGVVVPPGSTYSGPGGGVTGPGSMFGTSWPTGPSGPY